MRLFPRPRLETERRRAGATGPFLLINALRETFYSPSSGVRGSSTSLPFLVPCGPAWLPDRWWNSASDCATILALQARPFTEWGHMPLSFAVDIRQLFRDAPDIEAMKRYGLDVSSYEQVKEKAPEIYATFEDGSMRCDEHWPKDNVALFKRWMDEGMAA